MDRTNVTLASGSAGWDGRFPLRVWLAEEGKDDMKYVVDISRYKSTNGVK